MKIDFPKVYSMKNFFNIVASNQKNITFKLNKPSVILAHNIYKEWLQSLWKKSETHFPVFLDKPKDIHGIKLPFSYLNGKVIKFNTSDTFEYDLVDENNKTNLEFHLIVPQQDVMQYFFQWQKYRKYWWSTITTTPSLFCIGDIKYGERTADVDIIAQFPWASTVVEHVSVMMEYPNVKSSSLLSCSSTVEDALLTTLSDGSINSTKEGYLRLQRDVAPYKIAFAIENCDNSDTLYKLAAVLNNKLRSRNISTWFPPTINPLDSQIEENLKLGVVYTAILSPKTLEHGIFHLLNSSTMLKEQVHVADMSSYAETLFKGKNNY